MARNAKMYLYFQYRSLGIAIYIAHREGWGRYSYGQVMHMYLEVQAKEFNSYGLHAYLEDQAEGVGVSVYSDFLEICIIAEWG